jgi:hypothetical protein
MRMFVLPAPKLEAGPGDSILVWTDEDQDVLEFRFRRHYAPDDERFADFVAYGLVQDDFDAEIISRAVVSCNSLRMYDRMRTDWLIEDCELRHTLRIRP